MWQKIQGGTEPVPAQTKGGKEGGKKRRGGGGGGGEGGRSVVAVCHRQY